MLSEPEKASVELRLGSLSGCLVDGDLEQCVGRRRIRRRALAISIVLQTAVLSTLVLVPLFGKAERINLTIMTPVPPFSPYRNVVPNQGAEARRHKGPKTQCRFCQRPNIPPRIVMRAPASSTSQTGETAPEGIDEIVPGAPEGLIQLPDPRPSAFEPPNPERQVRRPQVVRMTRLDPAMLIHRVEPVYPPLALETHREGRVELRAIIGTDGTIESLEIVSSDPLFDLSAREAVSQWRYRPTKLNGQPVEVDTYITVVYTTRH